MSLEELCSTSINQSGMTGLQDMCADKKFQCFICSEKFSSAVDIADHIKSHSVRKAFHCGFCDESFHENSDLLSHIALAHGGLPVLYNCGICKVAFQILLSLEEHIVGCQGNDCFESENPADKARHDDTEAKDKVIKYLLNKNTCSYNATEKGVLLSKISNSIFVINTESENVFKFEVNDGHSDFEREHVSSDVLRFGEVSNESSSILKTEKVLGNTDKSLKHVQPCHLPFQKLQDDKISDVTVDLHEHLYSYTISHNERPEVEKALCGSKKTSPVSLENNVKEEFPSYISLKPKTILSCKQKNYTEGKGGNTDETSGFDVSSKQSCSVKDKGFFCPICMQACNDQKILEEHIRSHTPEECYGIRCLKCDVCFDNVWLLREHLEMTNCPGFKCSECCQSFPLEAKLLQHIVVAHKKGFEMKCSYCSKSFSSRRSWVRHEATHSETQPYMCKICGKHLSRLENILRYHLPGAHKIGRTTQVKKKSMVCRTKESGDKKDENGDGGDGYNRPGIHKERRMRTTQITRLAPKKPKRSDFSYSSLPKDKNRETEQKRWVCLDCDICGGKVSDHHTLTFHRSHHFMEDKSIIHCSGCPETFSRLADLTSHVHQKQCSKFKCEDCEQIFPTEMSYGLHKSESHSLPQESGTYSCMQCQQSFEHHSAYVDHSAEHVTSKPFQCKICSTSFSSEMLLEAHLNETHTLIKNDHEKNIYKCAQCLATFKTKMAIRVHQHFHMKRELLSESKEDLSKPESSFASYTTPFFCKICSVGLSGPIHLKRHEQLHHAVANKPKCHICGQSFLKNYDLKIHLSRHNRPFLCTVCGKTFPFQSKLKEHNLACHSTVNPFQCKQCHKFYSSRATLHHHTKRHSGRKRFECKICGQKFLDSNCLETHMLRHSTERPFKCPVCGFECKQKSVLSNHMDIHTGVKRHVCSYCGRRFRQRHMWKEHLKIHTGEKNFGCDHCGKRFARKEYLNVHILTHTKEKSRICPICDCRFAVASNLNVHVRKVHGEKDYKWFHEQKVKRK